MKANIFIRFMQHIALGLLLVFFLGCEREITDLELATLSDNPEVFIDGFSAGLNYAAFGGSVPTAFEVDNEVTWNNSAASMRFEVPNANDPRGSFAGGVFYNEVGRDLSGYNAVTFWAKATQSATIGEIGFGNDLGQNKYLVSIQGLTLSTGWKKYIIPIPDPSKLTSEQGMFWCAAGNIDGNGFTFWIDEVKYEKLGTIAHPNFAILNGEDQVETSFIGVTKTISGLTSTFNMPTGINQTINIAPAYFEFESSDPAIATVDENGLITVTGGPGNAEITARVGEGTADGSLTIESVGDFEPAPVPEHAPENVISIFSDAYENVPVEYYNGYWEPFQTTLSADFEVNGDRILHYLDFNFVGIQFADPTVDATSMTHLHVDIYLPNPLNGDAQFQIELVDFGAEVSGAVATGISVAQSQQWISLDIPLDDFTDLTSRDNLAQIIFVDVNENIPSFYADNIYFYDEGGSPPPPGDEPTEPAPTPTHNAANVLAIYSDAYDMVAETDFFPDWGQATVVTEIQIQDNNTLRYQGLDYQGIQLASSQNVSDMDFLHVDFWTANSGELNIFLISDGPVETPYSLTVPTTGWSSIDIPLSSFAPVDMNGVIQLKFDGNGDIFLDNIYFRKN
ncbi:MAG: glycosyl hydrolase family 16 [Bacteroidota bacterium]